MKELKYLKINLFVPYLIFILFFVLSRALLFFYTPIPAFHPDAFYYYYSSFTLGDADFLAFQNLPIDIPIGYPLFLIFASKLSSNYLIIALVSFIFFLSNITLLRIIQKHFSKYLWLILVFLILYQFNFFTIRYEVVFYSESIFRSLIIFYIAFYINHIFKTSGKSMIPLFIIAFLLMLFRANGIIFLVPLFFLFFIRQSNHYWRFALHVKKNLLFAFAFLFLLLSGTNYFVKGYFFPTDLNRYSKVIKKSDTVKTTQNQLSDGSITDKKEMIILYLKCFNQLQYDYYKIDLNADLAKINMMLAESNWQTMRLDINNFNDQQKKIILKEFNDPTYLKNLNETLYLDINDSFFYKLYLFFNFLYDKLLNTSITFLLYLTLLVFVIFKVIKKRFQFNKSELLILMFSMLYFLNIMFITIGHVRYVERYIVVFDVLVYISLFIQISYVLSDCGLKNKIKYFLTNNKNNAK